MDAVRVEDLGKRYPEGTEALSDVSLTVGRGQVFCLLGRNGAGKTTLLRILATQLRPTSGSASVFGYDVVRDADTIRRRIAVVPQEARPKMMVSGYDHIFHMCLIRGMSRADARARSKEVMEDLELWEHRDKLGADLSGGLRQRVIIGIALVADPELLFLDEPTIGLDPIGRRTVWNLVRRLNKKGVTVLLTTHYMEEAEALSDRLTIIERGRLAFLGTVDEAKSRTTARMQVIVESPVGNGASDREILLPESNEEIIEIVKRSLEQGRKVTFKPPTLEEAFIELVGGSIENEVS